ncbi:MAG: undecaprenyldiphospho-muramoylpentapeptide beta-N-acetylglucosaminyltransferase [bacterium]
MRVLIAAGGTGGHVYPGIAVAQRLRANNIKVLLVGKKKKLASRIAQEYELPFKGIHSAPFPRKVSFSLIKLAFILPFAILESVFIILSFKPHVIMGTGGYVSFPVVVAGFMLRVPTIIHEQNSIPGLTNRVLSKIATSITISFMSTQRYFPAKKTILTGNPVREGIVSMEKAKALEYLQLKDYKRTVLVLGGSQGAHSINRAVGEALSFMDNIRDTVQFIHITGEKDYDEVKALYQEKGYSARVAAFMHDIEYAYKSANIVICRAGATTLAEITTLGIAAVIVPYPFATDDHQKKNAAFLADHDAAVVILDEDLNGERLSRVIMDIISSEEKLMIMSENSRKLGKPKAAEEILLLIHSLAK